MAEARARRGHADKATEIEQQANTREHFNREVEEANMVDRIHVIGEADKEAAQRALSS